MIGDIAGALAAGVWRQCGVGRAVRRGVALGTTFVLGALLAAAGAVFLIVAAYMTLRHELGSVHAALICGSAFFVVGLATIALAPRMFANRRAKSSVSLTKVPNDDLVELGKKLGETVARNPGWLIAAAFAFGFWQAAKSGRGGPEKN